MPWTTPVSKSSGNVLNASDWTTNTVNNPNFLARPPRAYATMSSSQSISSTTASYTTVQINNLQVGGSGDNPTLVSNTLRPQVAGLYRVIAVLHWPGNVSGNTTGQRAIRITQNGSAVLFCVQPANSNPSGPSGIGQGTTQQLEVWITCAVNDQIGLGCFQEAAGAPSFSIQANTYLAMELIAVT